MEWYIPITILPGIGLIILSTSNLLISLNNEIRELNLEKDKYAEVIRMKMVQLKRINKALIGQYICTFLLVIAGVFGGISDYFKAKLLTWLVITGVIFLTLSIGMLITYAVKSLVIREKHLAC